MVICLLNLYPSQLSCNFTHEQLTAATKARLMPGYMEEHNLSRGNLIFQVAARVATRQRMIIVSKLMASYFSKDF